jgi:hypothetical protein
MNKIVTFTEPDIKHIIRSFPDSYKKFKEYIKNVFSQGGEREVTEQEIDGVSPTILLFSPRTLYDFFDEKNILVSVYTNHSQDKFFYFSIDGFPMRHVGNTGFHSRVEGERNGFIKAFELLENASKINITDTTPSGGDKDAGGTPSIHSEGE